VVAQKVYDIPSVGNVFSRSIPKLRNNKRIDKIPRLSLKYAEFHSEDSTHSIHCSDRKRRYSFQQILKPNPSAYFLPASSIQSQSFTVNLTFEFSAIREKSLFIRLLLDTTATEKIDKTFDSGRFDWHAKFSLTFHHLTLIHYHTIWSAKL
jgi:hypothetical protein